MAMVSEKNRKSLRFRNVLLFTMLMMTMNPLFPFPAFGADFPTKTIEMILSNPPGGPGDLAGRILGKRLSEILGKPVIVVNKAGGGQAIGDQAACSAPPDGHTILISQTSLIVLPLLQKGITCGLKDFKPINMSNSLPLCLIIKKDAPWKSMEELIADARKNPEKFSFSSSGPGSTVRLASELFQMETGTKFTHVPMLGNTGAFTGVLSGQVDLSFLGYQLSRPQHEAGALRILAILDTKRVKEFPGIPTVAERGYPKVTATTWNSFLVRVETPPAITDKLAKAFNDVLKEKAVRDQFENVGMTIENLPPKEAAKFLADEESKWTKVIQAAGLMVK